MSNISHRRGAVSIFVVIFTALLITIVTVSFVRLMVRDQQRASDGDLSRSAYDSAMVGVEDAKRALTRYYANPAAHASVDLSGCNTITELLTGSPSTDEVRVQTTAAADNQLNQAYTCVRVYTQTDDYDRAVAADETAMVPLTTPPDVGGSPRQFDHIRIQWFIETDLTGASLNLPASGTSVLSEVWPAGRPPVIEAQLIQTNSTFTLDQFDARTGANQNTNTLFLYPKRIAEPTVSFNGDLRQTPKTTVTDAGCTPTFSERYLCAITLQVPAPVGGTVGNRSNAYLRLTPRYKGAQVRVTLYNGPVQPGNLVQFDGVQPRIDSTGRADDLFRRVEVRVESGTNVVYPNAAADVSGSFCKTFSLTDRVEDYARGSCTP